MTQYLQDLLSQRALESIMSRENVERSRSLYEVDLEGNVSFKAFFMAFGEVLHDKAKLLYPQVGSVFFG